MTDVLEDLINDAVQLERRRCADVCERMAKIFDENAANTRAIGATQGFSLHFRRPFIRKKYGVFPMHEAHARDREHVAVCFRQVRRAILENWSFKS